MILIYLTSLVYGVSNYHSVEVGQSQQSELVAARR